MNKKLLIILSVVSVIACSLPNDSDKEWATNQYNLDIYIDEPTRSLRRSLSSNGVHKLRYYVNPAVKFTAIPEIILTDELEYIDTISIDDRYIRITIKPSSTLGASKKSKITANAPPYPSTYPIDKPRLLHDPVQTNPTIKNTRIFFTGIEKNNLNDGAGYIAMIYITNKVNEKVYKSNSLFLTQ